MAKASRASASAGARSTAIAARRQARSASVSAGPVAARRAGKSSMVVPAGAAVKLNVARAAKDARFRQAIHKLEVGARRTKQHPPAAEKAAEAQDAALPPPNERLAGAKANQVDAMKNAEGKKPAPTSFLEMLRAEIQKAMPKKVEDAEEYMKGDDRQQLKSAMTGKLGEQKEEATGELAAASKQPPDPTAVRGKHVVPLAAEAPATPPPPIGAGQAMPGPVPEAEVEVPMQQSKRDADQMLAENKISPRQLQRANDPRFSSVLKAKSEVEKSADSTGKAYRSTEQRAIGEAAAKANADERVGRAALLAVRGKAGAAVRVRQLTAKEKDEAERKKVTEHIENIFSRTKATVTRKLDHLESEVIGMFERGADAAVTRMRDYVETRFDDRYSGISGKALWLKDKLLPLPGSVKVWFTEAHAFFEQELESLVVRVANLVETRLKEAKDEITRGQKEVRTYVQSLPKNLQAVGKAAERELQGRFDELRQGVDARKNDLAQKLAQRYKEASDKGNAALQELKDKHKSLTERLADFVGDVIRILTEFKDKLVAAFRKGIDTIMLILSDPIEFLGNLLGAIKKGFGQFVSNIWTHLKAGLIAWLFGALAGSGIAMPKDFSLPSILDLVLQVLGLTYDRIRTKAVKLIGERNVMLVEKAWEQISALIKSGPAALWERIKEYFSNLKEMVLDGIQDWLITAIIKAAVMKIVSMFNPVGAIVQAVMMIYNTVVFIIERAKQIAALIEAVVNSVGEIARGAIGTAANWIEQALARFVPVVIGFLAALLGIGGISEKIRSIIQKLQSKVDQAIDKVIDKIVGGLKNLFHGGRKSEKPTSKETPGSTAVKDKVKNEVSSATINDAPQADALLGRVYGKYRPEGLKGIKLVVDPQKPGAVGVRVSASTAQIIAMLRRSPKLIEIARNLVPFSRQTTLYVYYDGNKPFPKSGKPFRNTSRPAQHAEQNFLNKLPELIQLIEERRREGQIKTPPGTPVPVTLDMNRSSCDNCADLLIAAAPQYKDQIKLRINFGSVYKADWKSFERTSVQKIQAMHDAEIELDVLKVWGVIKAKLQAEGVQAIQISKNRDINLNEMTGTFEGEEAAVRELLDRVIKKIKADPPLSKVEKGTP